MEHKNFMTINQTAKAIGLSRNRLCTMLANNSLPGFYIGSRYYVNFEMLKEQLERESRSRMMGGVNKNICQE